MKYLSLTQGQQTALDDTDYYLLNKYTGPCHRGTWRAVRISGTSRTGKIYHYGFKAGWQYRDDAGKIRKLWIHNLIMNPPPGFEVDHINGDPLDNRRENLRIVTRQQQCMNRGKRKQQKQQNASSVFLGVYFDWKNQKFRASIRISGQYIYLGQYTDEADAALAYNRAAREHFGEFARLNDITSITSDLDLPLNRIS